MSPQTLGQQTHVQDIKTRGDLYEWLEVNMARSYAEILEEQKLEPDQNLVKTYVIESNISPKFLKYVLRGLFDSIKVEPLEDYLLYRIDITDKDKKLQVHFFLDAKDSRFWRVFTLDKAQDVDSAYNKFVSQIKSRLDKLWLSNKLLKKFMHISFKDVYLRSISIKHDETAFSTEEEKKENKVSKLRIDGSGELVKDLLEIVEEHEKFRYMTRLTKIGIKLVEKEYPDKFVLEDLYYWGKFTAKGTSFDEHLEFIDSVVHTYRNNLKYIEDSLIDYSSWDWEKKIPLVYEFKKEISDLDLFAKAITTPKEPFRIWGFAKQVEKDMYIIVGTDLHNGDNFSLEVTPWWARLYLPKGSCGNTALRLLANIQQTYDAKAYLEVPQYGIRIR
ncbi:hypothetical protein, conserved [Thermococcus kodakarensis KOD1]|uniref:Uncharacterized protein n=1 Tax=Thermococcus kodakarensis (strain ATCC BAA-918 / JCM 12380 / KOD1) TaxID=69014 RepID=Q5JFC1_THEKO|nr:hypothetical protein [Thermococcus kodakarensis]WCN28640.1 hypothetical protein POG15_03045 [Thermococcus kodakarensis]WCN30938.1 hypothetical protein POG21_03045 [Thermococcus kodakarensis]BAD84782.1 hypothetical protein, conserved [Thermococcus kodakarensis KOD1]